MTPDPSSLPFSLKLIFMITAMFLNGIVVLVNTAMNTVNRSKIRQMADEEDEAARKAFPSFEYAYGLPFHQ